MVRVDSQKTEVFAISLGLQDDDNVYILTFRSGSDASEALVTGSICLVNIIVLFPL